MPFKVNATPIIVRSIAPARAQAHYISNKSRTLLIGHLEAINDKCEAINDKCYTCGRHNIIGVQLICLVIVIFVALCLV